jgi:DNA-binding NarL/FixJ family response regulator
VAAYRIEARFFPPCSGSVSPGVRHEVLRLAAEGQTNADIAAALGISPRTVETHRGNLMRKLSLRTLTDLIRCALRRGILPMEP